MIISHQHKVVFIKSMKTASSTTEAYILSLIKQTNGSFEEEYDTTVSSDLVHSFGSRGVRHKPINEIMPHTRPSEIVELIGREAFDSYLKIVNIRNPYDQMVSLFWWWMWFKEKENFQKAQEADILELREMFSNFVHNRRGLIKRARLRVFTTLNGQAFEANYIRFESLQSDIIRLSRLLETETIVELPDFKTDMRSQDYHYSNYYNIVSRLVIFIMNRWELHTFNYRFEKK